MMETLHPIRSAGQSTHSRASVCWMTSHGAVSFLIFSCQCRLIHSAHDRWMINTMVSSGSGPCQASGQGLLFLRNTLVVILLLDLYGPVCGKPH